MVNRLNLTGKHQKTKRKLQNPEERKRDRERGRERELLQFYKTPQITTKHICMHDKKLKTLQEIQQKPPTQEAKRERKIELELEKLTLKMRLLLEASHAKPPLKSKVQTNTRTRPKIASTCATNVKGIALTPSTMFI